MYDTWTLLIATVTSVVCAICGCLLLVNRRAMVSEGLSHAVLPGLVIAFIFVRDITSPWLIVSAAASGMVMVWLTQALQKTGLVEPDAGLGIVFAGMFSVGILLVSLELENVHFHADCIIDGDMTMAPLNMLEIGGRSFGPKALVVMSLMLVLTLSFVAICWKELKLMLFDPLLADQFRLRPGLIQFVTLTLISLTTVSAFNVAGSILIVALMVAPPAAALLLTNRLGLLLVVSSIIAVFSSFCGTWLAQQIDVAPNGPMAAFAGFVFLAVLLFAPRRGLLAGMIESRRQQGQIRDQLVLECITGAGEVSEPDLATMLRWTASDLNRVLQRLAQGGSIRQESDSTWTVSERSRNESGH